MFLSKSLAQSLIFIIAALCLSVAVSARLTEQSFYLHTNDRLCLDIDNILPNKELLNRLKVQSPADLEIIVPNYYKVEEALDFIPKLDPPASIVNVSNFGKKIALLLKQGDRNRVAIKEFDTKTKESKNYQIFEVAPIKSICDSALMDEENIYTVCYSDQHNLQFCSLNYIDDTSYLCNDFNFGLGSERPIESGTVRFDFYNGQGENKLWALYYSEVQPAYSLRKKFYLIDKSIVSLMELHDNVNIIKVSIVLYNKFTKEATVLILVEQDKVRSLRHYKIINSAFVETEDKKWFKLIKDNITDFIFKDSTLIVIKESENMPITITDIDLRDFSFLEYEMQGQKKLREVRGTINFFAFDTYNDQSQVEYSIFDIRNHRFLRLDSLGNIDPSTKWIIVPIGYSNYFFLFKDNKTTFFEIHPFQNVCVTLKPSLAINDQTVKFSLDNQPIFDAKILKKEYDFIMKNENLATGIVLNDNEHQERQVYLRIKGNNLEFSDDSPVYFFHPIIPQKDEENPDDEKCVSIKATIKNKNLITLCDKSKLIISKDFWLDRYGGTYSFEIKTIFDTKLDLSKAKILKVLFAQFILIITEDSKIYYMDLEAKNYSVLSNAILTNFKACVVQKQQFICKEEDDNFVIINSIKSANELEFVLERQLSLPNAESGSILVSSYLKDTVYYIRKSFHSEKYHLIKQFGLTTEKLNIGNLQLMPSTIIFEIAENEIIIINDPEGSVGIYAFIENSLIDYPFQNQKIFNKVIDYTFIEEAKIFCVLYADINEKMFLYVAQPSLEVYNRVIKDTLVGDYSEDAKIEAHYVSKTMILFFVYTLNSADGQYSFIYFLNSPIYSIAADSNAQTMLFRLNGKRYNQPFERVVRDSELSISNESVRIDDPDQETILFDLEKSKKIQVQGDLLDVYDAMPGDNVVFIPRANFKSRTTVRRSKDGLDSTASSSLMIDGQGFVFFYNDFFYKNNEGQTNKNFKNCKRVDIITDDPNLAQLFFCKDKKSGKNLITNLSDIAIVLEQSTKKLKKFKAIKDDKDLYLACVAGSQKRIYFYKFILMNKDYKLEFLKTFTANNFFIETEAIDNFFMFKNIKSGKILFLIHELFSSNVLVQEFDIQSNVFDKQASDALILKDKEPINIHELYCIQVVNQANCFIRSDRYIYDVIVDTTKENYSFIAKTKYRFTEQFSIEHKINFAVTEKYLAVLLKREKGYDALIYQRNSSPEEKHLYSSIRIKDDEKFTRIAMVDDKETGYTSLYVSIFHKRIDDSSTFFKYLSIDEYQLGNMGLEISKESTGYKRILELNFLNDSGDVNKVFLEVILSNNYRNFLLMIVLIILTIVLIVAVSVVVSVHHQNRKLLIEMEANNPADNSAFLDRTHLQI